MLKLVMYINGKKTDKIALINNIIDNNEVVKFKDKNGSTYEIEMNDGDLIKQKLSKN